MLSMVTSLSVPGRVRDRPFTAGAEYCPASRACQRRDCDGLSTTGLWGRVAAMERFWESGVRLARQLAGGIGAAAGTGALVPGGLLEPPQTRSLDPLFELPGARAPGAPLLLLASDRASDAALNTPWAVSP